MTNNIEYLDTFDFVNKHKTSHPIVYNLLKELLLPTLRVEYLPNYNPDWGSLGFAKTGDACFDLRSCLDGLISKNFVVQIPLGIRVAVPAPFVMKLYMRSGQAKNKGIELANGVGIIDQGYRGEVFALIKNASGREIYIDRGERIVQASLELAPMPTIVEDSLNTATERGAGGFGHTGT